MTSTSKSPMAKGLKQDVDKASEYSCIYFKIFKETKKFDQSEIFEADKPLLHLNTLAQIIYESYKDLGTDDGLFTPVIIVLSKYIVQGINKEGIYLVDLSGEKLVYIEEVYPPEWRPFIGETESTLAIGYVLNVEVAESISPKDIIEKSEGMIKKMRRIVELHGELEDVIYEGPVGVSNLSLSYLQWVKNKKFL